MRWLLALALVACTSRTPGPADVHRWVRTMAKHQSARPSDLPRLVELLDDTEPHMTGECLRLITEGDPLARGVMAAGEVNSYGARVASCRLQPWPTTAGYARTILVGWRDQNRVADLLVARALASPSSSENLASAARGSPALAAKVVAALRVLAPRDDTRRSALLRLALEVDGGDAEALRAERGTRAAAVMVRWTSASPASVLRSRALEVLRSKIDQPGVLEDLTKIGGAAGAVLSPQVRARMWKRAARSKYELAAVVDVVVAARVDLRANERARLARIYDRLCEEPDRRIEREMGEFFTMWRGPDVECGKAHAAL